MQKDEWRQAWINTLVNWGIYLEAAEAAFDTCYANQQIDLATDPLVAASAFVPIQIPNKKVGNSDTSSTAE